MTTASLLLVAAFSLMVMLLAFAWLCLLEVRHPLYPRRAFTRRAHVDRRAQPAPGWPEWLDRRSGDERRAPLGG